MTEAITKEAFVALLGELAQRLQGIDLAASDRTARVDAELPIDGELVRRARAAAAAVVGTPWLLPKENAGIRFGRVAKELHGFSVDAVLMDKPGPRHRHPHGEIDLCIARSGAPRFDGKPEGWVVYGPDSTHVPTVAGGEMLILYFLPGGAIEFLAS